MDQPKRREMMMPSDGIRWGCGKKELALTTE